MKVVRPGTAAARGSAHAKGPWWKIRVTPAVSVTLIVVVVALIYGIYWFTHRGGAARLPMHTLTAEEEKQRWEGLSPEIREQLRTGQIDWSELPSQSMSALAERQKSQAPQTPQTPQAPR
jgi:hypothetical protein